MEVNMPLVVTWITRELNRWIPPFALMGDVGDDYRPWGQPVAVQTYGAFFKCGGPGAFADSDIRRGVVAVLLRSIGETNRALWSRGGGLVRSRIGVVINRGGADPEALPTVAWRCEGYDRSSYVPSPEFGTDMI